MIEEKFSAACIIKKQKLIEKSKENAGEQDGKEVTLDEHGMPVVRFKFKEKSNIKDYLDKSLKKVRDEDKKELILRKMDALSSGKTGKKIEYSFIDESNKYQQADAPMSNTLSDSEEGEIVDSPSEEIKEKLRSLNSYLTSDTSELPSHRPEEIDLIYKAYDPVSGEICKGGQLLGDISVKAKFNGQGHQMIDFKVVKDNKSSK